MRTLLRFVVSVVVSQLVIAGQAQEILYQWLNQGCFNVIHCDGTCTACDTPVNSSNYFMGTNTIWIGVDVCPHPIGDGDNALFSTDWPLQPEGGSFSLMSGLTMAPMQIDTIKIRHARSSYGPHRLKVSFSYSPEQPFVEVADVYVDWNFQETVITDIGCVPLPASAPYGIFQVRFQAYEATGEGSWVLDELRIKGSTCSDISTVVQERDPNTMLVDRPLIDVLGRKVGTEVSPGIYMGARRIVVVQ